MRAIGPGLRHLEVEDGRGLLRVLCDVDEHRAGATGGRDLEGLAYCRRDVFSASDEEVMLRDGQGDAGDVDLLEGVSAQDFGGDLPGDGDDRDRVKHRGGEAGDEVRRAGPGG